MSFLSQRAEEFLEQARFAYGRGYYDLVMFNVEQFMQLKLKSLLYNLVGDYPRTHRLTQLFMELMKVLNDKCHLNDFYTRNREVILLLEFAYIASRYMPPRFNRNDAEKALNIANEFNEVVKCLLS
ncbi:HEPN domain-containing protein [Vulcanisaeta distributa]|uniref:HEPN domain protein n=1 Tax=Vulcanisaeta distributa (strain DSM 14429 / JCM 11212 / NBRC 100878 / IC-017) TaxID=572478 RepID=E1QTG8_VULDI|nr:HEPN domain-containing protein [Vulcanisaeta distributa]ADN50961.1 HEPN domain protein [Vulcanisaeta distributa DSM 14429]